MVTTNEIKKGWMVKLRNGFTAKCLDDRKGNIRRMEVYGVVTESGDVYAHDIVAARPATSPDWTHVSITPAQKKAQELNRAFFGD